MRSLILITTLCFTLAGCHSSSRQAEHTINLATIEDPIERVRIAYQTERLNQANTIRLESEIRQEYPDHDYSPDFHDMSSQRMHHIIDIKNNSGSSEYLTRISNTYYHGRSVLVDGISQFIVYPSSLLQEAQQTDFISQYGATIRSSDAMLALWLEKASDNARIEGEEMWLGKLHDKVTFDFPNSPPLTILVQKDTGYISKMSRVLGEGMTVFYTFDYHSKQNGIPVASELSVYLQGIRLFYSFNQRLILNDSNDSNAFEIESDIAPEPERVDQSIMTAEAITNDVYQVGQDESYTTFIQTTKGLIAFGLEAGFADRLQAYRDKTNNQSLLSFAIAANHHNIRIAGVAEALSEGATLLIPATAKGRVHALLGDVDALLIETISTSKTIGSVTVYNISTSNAAENLIAFESQSRSILQTSHYAAPYKNERVWAEFNGVTFLQGLAPLGLSPNIIISSESRRPESWSAFENAVADHVTKPCMRKRKICENWG